MGQVKDKQTNPPPLPPPLGGDDVLSDITPTNPAAPHLGSNPDPSTDSPTDETTADGGEPLQQTGAKQFSCEKCGAKSQYRPGSSVLNCPYCGHETVIPESQQDISELDYEQTLRELAQAEETQEHDEVQCQDCHARFETAPTVTATQCPYCSAPIVAGEKASQQIKPRSLLPFKVDHRSARERYKQWLNSLWFAPNKLKQYARLDDRLVGLYVPYWTYDAATTSFYSGQRGTTHTVGSGKNRRTVTRWTNVSGTVFESFDDILVMASQSLPTKYADRLEPWDLHELVPYDKAYLSGFQAESYQIDLSNGFGIARGKMDEKNSPCD